MRNHNVKEDIIPFPKGKVFEESNWNEALTITTAAVKNAFQWIFSFCWCCLIFGVSWHALCICSLKAIFRIMNFACNIALYSHSLRILKPFNVSTSPIDMVGEGGSNFHRNENRRAIKFDTLCAKSGRVLRQCFYFFFTSLSLPYFAFVCFSPSTRKRVIACRWNGNFTSLMLLWLFMDEAHHINFILYFSHLPHTVRCVCVCAFFLILCFVHYMSIQFSFWLDSLASQVNEPTNERTNDRPNEPSTKK